jgi:hypothetical protein
MLLIQQYESGNGYHNITKNLYSNILPYFLYNFNAPDDLFMGSHTNETYDNDIFIL